MAFLSTLIFVLMWKLGCCVEFINELLIYQGPTATQNSAHPAVFPTIGSTIVENAMEIVQHSRDDSGRYPWGTLIEYRIIGDTDQDYSYDYFLVASEEYSPFTPTFPWSFFDGEGQQMNSLRCEDGAVNTSDCIHADLCTPESTVAECCREVVERDPTYCSTHWLFMRKCCKESCGLCEKSVGPTACHDMSEAACHRTGGCVYRGDTEQCVDLAFCQDGVKNGDEEGVDCGGSCPNRCHECSFIEIDESPRPTPMSYKPCSAPVIPFTSGYCHCAEHDTRMLIDGSQDFHSTCDSICSCKVEPNCVLSYPLRHYRRGGGCRCERCYGEQAPVGSGCLGCTLPIKHCMEYEVDLTSTNNVIHRCICSRCERGMIFVGIEVVDSISKGLVRTRRESPWICQRVCDSNDDESATERLCAPVICEVSRYRPYQCHGCAGFLGKMCITGGNRIGKCSANRCIRRRR